MLPTTHLAVVERSFEHSQLTQLNDSSFLCNFLSPSAVSSLQLTTSAHPFPSFDFLWVFRSALLCFPSVFFRLCFPCFRSVRIAFRLLDFTVLPFLFFPGSPHSGSPGAQVPLTVSLLSPFHSVWFPVPRSRFQVLGNLLVSFRPSQLRSRSRSTGDQLSLPCGFLPCSAMLPLSFVRFRLGLNYSAFCFFLSLLPGFSLTVVLSGAASVFRLPLIHRPFRLLPCFRFDFGTQLSCNPFSDSLLRITGATAASGLLFPARPFPLAFALGSGT